MRINPDSGYFNFTGRISFENSKEPLFIYPGTMAETVFSGTSVGIYIKNEKMGPYTSIGVLIDNLQYKFDLSKEKENEEIFINVAQELEDKEHTLVVFKTQGAANYIYFCGIEVDESANLRRPEKNYKLKIDVYGDSVSAGEVTEAIYYTERIDPENHNGCYDNSWFSYPFILGRLIDAEVYDNSQGGIALLDKTGFFCGPDEEKLLGMESVYDKLSFVPYSNEGITEWDFSRFTPDLVIFAIGQNDPNPHAEVTDDPLHIKRWKEKYKEIILDLKSRYGEKTKFLLMLTVLMHDPKWDKYMDEVVEELNDDNIKRFYFTRCGKATPGHPKLSEQTEMAVELRDHIKEWFNLK